MKRLAVAALSLLLNAWYALCRQGARRDEALFLSRQSDSMSVDFRLLADELEKRGGWRVVARTHMVEDGATGALGLVGRMFGDVRALARCRICFVEGYNPAVSLLDMECAHAAGSAAADIVNRDFPTTPVVMQVWHAAGHFKKFGYEALDTPEGRSSADAAIFRMHRNYSWIACSGEGARAGFAQAFGYPVERVVALGHPSFDELHRSPDAAIQRVHAVYPQINGTKPVIVYAPTLHRTAGDAIFAQLREALAADPRSAAYEFVWSFHPVSLQGTDIRVTTRDLLRCASLVVTDYSSVVYDAAILGVPFAFYTPDIAQYRVSPGLATDPGILAPNLCLSTPDELLGFLDATFQGGCQAVDYPHAQRDAFIADTLSACGPDAARRIVDFTLQQVKQ